MDFKRRIPAPSTTRFVGEEREACDREREKSAVFFQCQQHPSQRCDLILDRTFDRIVFQSY